MPGVIVPRKTVADLLRLTETDGRNPSSCRRRRSACRPAGQVVLTSKLIDGTFPDYERVIPQGMTSASPELDNTTFEQAVDRNTLSSDKAGP